MIRECAWCREVLEFSRSETDKVTHTICEHCERRMKLEVPGKDFVDHLQAFASIA